MRIRPLACLVVLCALMLAAASPAWAQNPAQNAYAPSSTQQLRQTLPFTGIDAGGVALVGIAFLGAGLLARQRTRSRPRLD